VERSADAALPRQRPGASLPQRDGDADAELTLLRAAVEGGLDGMVVVSSDGRMIATNHQFQQMWPIPEEVIASGSDDLALQSVLDKLVDPEGFLARVRQLYADPTGSAREELLLRDGRVFDRYGTALRDDDGAYVGWAWYFRDVTAERAVARASSEASERFAALARTLQETLLPPHLPELPGIEVAARHLPAGRGGELVGDFYDVFQTGRATWGVVMGDVCGKGVEAAKVTALARYTIRAAAIEHRSPRQVLHLLNAAMRHQHPDSERFVTATYATLQQRKGGLTVRLSAAGHPPALLRRPGGVVEAVEAPGQFLGVFDDPVLVDKRRDLSHGDALVLYTDGVIEARRGREQYGEDRLRALLADLPDDSGAAEIARAVEQDVLTYGGPEPADDTAVLVLRVPEAPAG
jgi:serine phosphatase RsbU (regulator of sigma subunit)